MPISPTLKLRAKRNKVRITFENGFGQRKQRKATAVKKEVVKKEKKSPKKKVVQMYRIPAYRGGGLTKCKTLSQDPKTGKCISPDSKIYKDNVARGRSRLNMMKGAAGLLGAGAMARQLYKGHKERQRLENRQAFREMGLLDQQFYV